MSDSTTSRREFLKGAAAATIAAAAWSGGSDRAAPADDTGKNVLFVIVDDLNNDLGCYGHPIVRTPNMDRIASMGVRFDRMYCQLPVCGPTRSSLFTGLRPQQTGVFGNRASLRENMPDVVTFPQLFNEQGYHTARLGKIYNHQDNSYPKEWDAMPGGVNVPAEARGGEGRDMSHGKLRWCRWRAPDCGDEDLPDGQRARHAIQLLENMPEEPFFLALGFSKPHDPFVAPKRYFDMYPLEEMQLPQEPPYRSPKIPGAVYDVFAEVFTDRDRREFLRSRYACTTYMDAQFGKVLDAMDRLGLLENTVIALIGDHGYHHGEHEHWNKDTLYEQSARAPFLMYDPQVTDGPQACSAILEFVDIFPTMTELCGLPTPPGLAGESFVPLLRDPNSTWENVAYTEVRRHGGRSVRTERWRYSEWEGGERGKELYDHYSDPGEYFNLAGYRQYAEVQEELADMVRSNWGDAG